MEVNGAHPPRFEREHCLHLSDLEWDALVRMSAKIGSVAIGSILQRLSHDEQHATIVQFMDSELKALLQQSEAAAQAVAQAAAARPAAPPRVQSLKLDVSKYRGEESEPLLRWLVELDSAIAARQIVDPEQRVAFAMSCLAGRAKSWAFGRRMSDNQCFATYEAFKEELKETFEPPKSEFRARAEYLDLRQGKRDIHAYAQRARYLVSCIVRDPMDDATQVVTFMKGLNDGLVKTYLFREYPDTLEAAISLAIQEDFSLKQSKGFGPRKDKPRPADEAEPMDLSSADLADRKRTVICHRCQKRGHVAYQCLAAKPTPRDNASRGGKRSSSLNSTDAAEYEEESKNDDDQ